MKNKTEFLHQLSQRIRTQRQQKNFSQESFARQAKIARRYYSDLENGKINPSIVHLMKIALALEVPLLTLVPDGFLLHELSEDNT